VTTATEARVRTRAELLERQQQNLAEREAELVARIEASPHAEAAARREHLLRSPLSLPGATSQAVRERKRREQAEADLVNVRANLATIAELLEEARQEDRAAEMRRLSLEAEALRRVERAAVRALGERFAAFVEAFGDYKLAAEALYAWRVEASARTGLNGDALEVWRNDAGRHAVVPVIGDLGAAVETCIAVCLDPHGEGYRDGGRTMDDYRELVALLPNLQGEAATAVDVLGVERRVGSRTSSRLGSR
jgi:hypothetical protein